MSALIVFSHANSFAASTYGVLFRSLRSRGFQVRAPEKFGHDPAYPVTSNWPQLVRQLHNFAEDAVRGHEGPLYYVGHSLGGYLSLMTACRHPRPAGRAIDGVLLIDSPVVSGWRATAVQLAKSTGAVGALGPGSISRRRRQHWASRAEARAHFTGKPLFAAWEPAVLDDYLAHGLQDTPDGGCTLAFDRTVETAIYNTLPHNLDRLLRRHPPPCPVGFIGGTRSAEMRQVGIAMTQRITQGRIAMLEGSHLFPMEKPLETAAAIEAALRSF
ncbi:alpha/beta hydrolase [Xylophilus sp. GW821-FHT01B05]